MVATLATLITPPKPRAILAHLLSISFSSFYTKKGMASVCNRAPGLYSRGGNQGKTIARASDDVRLDDDEMLAAR